MTVKELFDAGDLTEAISAVTEQVKADPSDAQHRTLLFELLVFQGELDRAEKQLDVIAHGTSETEWAAQVYRNVLTAERKRRRLFTDGLKPEFLLDPPSYISSHLEAINRLREGRPSEARQLLEQSEQQRPTLSGTRDELPFEGVRDCDDVLAPVLELYIIADYLWVPLEQVREVEISAPERPRDLIWAPARLLLSDGTQRRGYMPVLYWDSFKHEDDQVKLGRATDWNAVPDGPVLGWGQRLLLTGDDDRGLLEIRRLEIQSPD